MPKKHGICSMNFVASKPRFHASTLVAVHAGNSGLSVAFDLSQNDMAPSIISEYANPLLTIIAPFAFKLLVKTTFNFS